MRCVVAAFVGEITFWGGAPYAFIFILSVTQATVVTRIISIPSNTPTMYLPNVSAERNRFSAPISPKNCYRKGRGKATSFGVAEEVAVGEELFQRHY